MRFRVQNRSGFQLETAFTYVPNAFIIVQYEPVHFHLLSDYVRFVHEAKLSSSSNNGDMKIKCITMVIKQ